MTETGLVGVPEQNTLEIIKTSIITVSKLANTDSANTQIAHNLGYVPSFLGFYTDADEAFYTSLTHTEFTTGGLLALRISLDFDMTNINANVEAPNVAGSSIYSNASTYYIRYYLLRQVAKK